MNVAGELDVKTNVDDSENVGSGSMMTVRPDAANAVPASSLPLTAPAAVATIPAALATEDATMDIDEGRFCLDGDICTQFCKKLQHRAVAGTTTARRLSAYKCKGKGLESGHLYSKSLPDS